jgi:tRNA(Ile)-lysidine synthase
VAAEDIEARRLKRRFESAVRRYALDHGLLAPACRVLAAVSGGPDSSALLLALSRLGHRGRFEVAAAYFDHGLRGTEASAREQRCVQALALQADVPLFRGGPGRRPHRGSLEASAREQRYAFLAHAAQENGYDAVATGHTASDQAETLLLNIMRGSGLDGLGGMAPLSSWPFPGHPGLRLVRPLLRLTRDDTLAYCRAGCLTPLEDETNLSLEFSRNRVRHQLLPAMREFNPRVEEALVRLSESARADASFLDALAASAAVRTDTGVALDRRKLGEWPPSLRRRALLEGLRDIAGDARDFGQRHLTALETLVAKGLTGDRLDLPRRTSALLARDALLLRSGAPGPSALPLIGTELLVPGEAAVGPIRARAGSDADDAPAWTSAELDAMAVGRVVEVRRRRPGDRMQPLGMGGTKKLQDILVDAGVLRDDRDAVPVFANARGIVWLGGLRIADWAKPQPGRPTVHLSFLRVERSLT